MTSHDAVQFISTITKQLNDFFGEICNKNYHFECATESRKIAEDLKSKQLKKAFRIYKKQNIGSFGEEISEKEKEKILMRNWDRINEEQKLKYLEMPKLTEKKVKKKKEEDNYKPPQNI